MKNRELSVLRGEVSTMEKRLGKRNTLVETLKQQLEEKEEKMEVFDVNRNEVFTHLQPMNLNDADIDDMRYGSELEEPEYHEQGDRDEFTGFSLGVRMRNTPAWSMNRARRLRR